MDELGADCEQKSFNNMIFLKRWTLLLRPFLMRNLITPTVSILTPLLLQSWKRHETFKTLMGSRQRCPQTLLLETATQPEEEEEKQESKQWGGIVSQTGGGELSGNSQGELPKNRIAAMKVSCRLVTAWWRSGGANPLRRRNLMYW